MQGVLFIDPMPLARRCGADPDQAKHGLGGDQGTGEQQEHLALFGFKGIGKDAADKGEQEG